MRLCIVALFEKEVSHAELVHDSQRVWRRCELIFDYSFSDTDQRVSAEDIYALSIMQNLGVIARQTHKTADAILFWLSIRGNGLVLEDDGYDVFNFLLAGSRSCRKISTTPLFRPTR